MYTGTQEVKGQQVDFRLFNRLVAQDLEPFARVLGWAGTLLAT